MHTLHFKSACLYVVTAMALLIGFQAAAHASVRADVTVSELPGSPPPSIHFERPDRDAERSGTTQRKDDDPSSFEEERSAVVSLLERFSSMPALAWPAVRGYIWERYFAGRAPFVAYETTRPGHEHGSSIELSLLLDETIWLEMDAERRQRLLDNARARVAEATTDLGISGSVRFMIAAGVPQ